MRVGLVIYGSLEQQSGGYLYDRKVLQFLQAQGDQVELLCLPWRSYPRHLFDNLSPRLVRRLSQWAIDILIEDELNHPSLAAINCFLRRRKRFPLTSIVHHLRLNEEISGWQRWLTRIVEKSFLSSLDGLICNSQTTLHSVRALLGSNASDPLCAVVAYPGKDHLRGGLTEREIDRRARDGKELRVLFLGNLIPRKGVHWLLAALDASRDFPFHLDLVGDEGRDPTYARHLRQRVEQAGLSDRVRFWGLVAEDTLQRILQENQVLVVPSAYEGFGIAYLDGMRYGLAIVASASGGAGELITEGREGYLIAPGDVFALAKRLRHLHNDRGHLAEMGIAARKRFAEHPTWAESAAKIRQFLLHFLE